MSIISIVSNGIIAVILGWVITKKLTEQRYEKEYLISDLKLIEINLTDLKKKLEEDKVEIPILDEYFHKIGNSVDKFIGIFDIISKPPINKKEIEDLRKLSFIIYAEITNIDASFLDLNRGERAKYQELMDKYINLIRSLILKINKG
ncbi:hypothetical protein E0494_10150 [Marinilabiliaceae bacterium JC040]|nr:hypothetical protein [Marinilabiliaceae bacterium JC040]